MYVCMHACMHLCVYACMCVYVCMYLCMYVCMYRIVCASKFFSDNISCVFAGAPNEPQDVISYTTAISACADSGHWKEALQLLAEMERAGIKAHSQQTLKAVCLFIGV